jgi:predicted alpha/beta hydrolase family esterase
MTDAHIDKKQVLFVHGGGEGGYEADAKLAASLQAGLGAAYNVRYPRMPNEDSPDFGWGRQIGLEIGTIKGEVILVGHSLGASMLLKFLSENTIRNPIGGIFLLATPFWRGDENWQKGLMLREDFADRLPNDAPIFLYHSRNDEEVDVVNLAIYAEKLPQATIREAASGGHQFGNDLTQVARDIKNLLPVDRRLGND